LIDWNKVAEAAACRIQFEFCCGRERLVREDFAKIVVAEALQSQVAGAIEPEYNHPDLPGNTRLDLLVRSPQAKNIQAAVELKWVRRSTDTTMRNWAREIFADVLRVERLQDQMAQGSERVVLVVGEAEEMRRKVWEVRAQAGDGQPRQNVVSALLQQRNAVGSALDAPNTVNLANVSLALQRFVRASAPELMAAIPTTFNVRIAAHYSTKTDGIECVVWKVSRPQQQRVLRTADQIWPPVNPPALG
jgi:hypothetical protein